MMRADSKGVVHIGNARGKIAVYLDETEAIDLAYLYGPRDDAYRELMEAVETAYPKEDE
jgi:hypothetical protein